MKGLNGNISILEAKIRVMEMTLTVIRVRLTMLRVIKESLKLLGIRDAKNVEAEWEAGDAVWEAERILREGQ